MTYFIESTTAAYSAPRSKDLGSYISSPTLSSGKPLVRGSHWTLGIYPLSSVIPHGMTGLDRSTLRPPTDPAKGPLGHLDLNPNLK